ncbi:hypothetical protein POM88_000080 [Heracleum sosnowskyi]|uniref:Uncharacterized protein n=1 Tax=Heracleum sosnowskyi TaxID=360622 RepID=A0AAD8J9M2_9APIA|nr:hypothetical protein POM88_000080 [Heracleum sosnowskyi]
MGDLVVNNDHDPTFILLQTYNDRFVETGDVYDAYRHARDSHPLEFQAVNERALNYGHQQGVYRTERFENPKGLEETDLPCPDPEGLEEPDLPGPDGNGIFLGGSGPVPDIFLGGPAPVGEQDGHIHTSDPNFIGGSKAVELAVHEMKSLRAVDSTIARHEDGSEKSPSYERSLKSRAILARQANGIILQQGARPATESTAPGSTTGSSWGISSIFGGSDNRVAAKENLTSKPSNEPIQTIEPSSSMIHLGEMLDELPVDADAVERGFSLNAEPTGLPRIHGLPSYSFDSTSRGSTESYTASPKNPRSCKSSHSGELFSSHITAYSNGGGCN